MLPFKKEWKSWSALDRATYIAQMVAILSLLPTVTFAWLGWREARLARHDQMVFFAAANSPELEIISLRFVPNQPYSKGLLVLTIKNVGGSDASQITLHATVIGRDSALRDTRNASDPFRNLGLPKGKEMVVPFLRVEDITEAIGYEPRSVRVYAFGDRMAKGEKVPVLLSATFEDVSGKSHGRLFTISMAP